MALQYGNSRSLDGPALKTQGPTVGPATLARPPVSRSAGLTAAAMDAAHLFLPVETDVAYTPGRLALGAA